MSDKKCRYVHCCHPDHKISDDDTFVKVGSYYYHEDCNVERIATNRIIDVWKQSVDPAPIVKNLRRVINNVVNSYNIKPTQLLFQLTWCISNGWNIRHPWALHYIAKCEDAKAAFRQSANIQKFADDLFVVTEQEVSDSFAYTPQKTGFGRILK